MTDFDAVLERFAELVAEKVAAKVHGNGTGQGNGKASGAVELLTVREAAKRLQVTPQWIYHRSDSLPFVRRLGPKTMRCDADGVAKWLAKR